MNHSPVAVFAPYPFQVGQRIAILHGPRRGDWEVVAVDARRLKLRCPISGREVDWERFCYLVEESGTRAWPQGDAP
jgi:hypothetical protein